MNKEELIEALEIAVGNYDFDGEYQKSEKVSAYIEKIKLDTYPTELENQFAEGVLYALDYLSDLYEDIEDTDIAQEYNYTREA